MLKPNIFGGASTARLFHLDTRLSMLCYDVLVHYNISILDTTRNARRQMSAFNDGFSEARFGESPHNYNKALAVDVGLWDNINRRVNYNDKESFIKIMKCFKLHAEARGIEVECGVIDWGYDFPHVQIKSWRSDSIDRPLVQ